MIHASEATPSTFVVDVIANDNIFEQLGNNTYNFTDLISELIDNSIAARVPQELLDVHIVIGLSNHRDRTFFIITDNASGISREHLGDAISPAALQDPDSLNEHGLGMKQAVASLGKLDYLATKTSSDAEAMLVREFRFGKIEPRILKVPWEHGTEIRVAHLRPIVPASQNHYTRDVVRHVGARYRRLLRPDAPQMRLYLRLVDADSEGGDLIYEYKIEPVKPVYFHPHTRQNKPVIEGKTFKGKGWEAQLTFGYAPVDKEYADLGLEKPNKFDPYHVSWKNQGLDIIMHDRVIQFHVLSEVGLVQTKHNDYNVIRGEIDLQHGFSTAITKNAIMQDDHFLECVGQIKEFLDGHEYLKRKTYPEDLPEQLLRDRLAQWLTTNRIAPRKKVTKEFAVQGLGGSVDILADGEPWEVKREEASGLDAYQLFAYLDMGGFEKGYLVAKSFSTGAVSAQAHILAKHKKEIVLTRLDEYPVLHPMTDKERGDYF